MASAMARVLVVLCVAFLVVHVDGARTLKEVTGETHGSEGEVFAVGDDTAIPAPVDEPVVVTTSADETYNYNENGSTTSTTDDSGAAGFADEGFLVSEDDSSSDGGSSFATDDVVAPDQDTDSDDGAVVAQDSPVEGGADDDEEGGKLIEDVDGPSGDASTASFADGGVLADPSSSDDSKPYTYDATADDADTVVSAAEEEKSSDALSFADAGTAELPEEEPVFQFDDSQEDGN